ncbi:ATP-grasp domain-containing protein (plasmid) [Skermanella rosea]|uniref:ATP-grasp domain-containing protein n=1 Tax=Skermanella rosea TaxID=1817965 RepID=UPI001932D7BA|nr:ATP-grasp domain-containing protein [Skermanella rosea]UEM07354.1 ATP-grasp domain-containing protein [Skermanella rosea]
MANALVLASGFFLQYRTLRCAAKLFSAVYVLGERRAKPMRASIACDGFFDSDHEFYLILRETVDQINSLCRTLKIDIILPSDASTTRFISRYRDQLHAAVYPVPSPQSFDTLNGKHNFATLCTMLGVPHPKTTVVARKQDLAHLGTPGSMQLPAVVKPLGMWGSYGVRVVDYHNKDDVLRSIQYEPVLIQEFVEGKEVSAFYHCRSGEILAGVCYNISNGVLTFTSLEEVDRNAGLIADYLKIDGVIGFDVMVGRNGEISFLECNPRFWYNMDVVEVAGINFVSLGIESLINPSCNWEMVRQRARDLQGQSFMKLSALLASMAKPWLWRRIDRRMLRYYAQDLVPVAWTALYSFTSARSGSGYANGSLGYQQECLPPMAREIQGLEPSAVPAEQARSGLTSTDARFPSMWDRKVPHP